MRIVALIPAHQEQDSVGRTVEALLHQERIPDLMVVIVDNCTDATYERAVQAADGHPAVIVVRTVANANRKPGALNWAWSRYCQDADLLVTLDADTCLPPHASPTGSGSLKPIRGWPVRARSSRCLPSRVAVAICWSVCNAPSWPAGP